MGPHSVLKVRGGQPIEGGPAFDPVLAESLSHNDGSEKQHQTGANMVLGPIRDESALPISLIVNFNQDDHRPMEAGSHDETEVPMRPFRDGYINTTSEQIINEMESDSDRMENEYEPTHSEHGRLPYSDDNRLGIYPEPQHEKIAAQSDPDAFQILAKGLTKTYIMGTVSVPVLKGVNLGVHEGEFVSIVGQSGSGKSTLLHLLGTLDTPDDGTIHFDGQRIDNVSSGQRDILRNRFIGMIFQFYHLLPELTTIENVLSPLMIRENVWGYFANRSRYHKMGEAILEQVGLSHRLQHKPNELSGGEMQRAAIARALISEPQILLADEPTGNLDAKNAAEILDLLRTLNREKNLTIIMVTHDTTIAQSADRTVRIVDGICE